MPCHLVGKIRWPLKQTLVGQLIFATTQRHLFLHSRTRDVLWVDAWLQEKVRPAQRGGASQQPGLNLGARYEEVLEGGTWGKLCQLGHVNEAVQALDGLVQRGYYVPVCLHYLVLKGCSAGNDLAAGKQLHALTCENGYNSSTFLANHLIRMYSSHGQLQEATQVFSKLDAPDSFMWASIILAHAEHQQPTTAVAYYQQMRQLRTTPNNYAFVAALKACANALDLASGKQVHADVLGIAVDVDLFVGSSLVDMYVKCGSLEDARRVFDNLPERNVVTWNVMLTGYAQHGLAQEALTLYSIMEGEGIQPDNVTLTCLLKACASLGALHQGKQLHSLVEKRGLEGDLVVANSLVDMYAKCGSLEDARAVFDRLPIKDVITWNAMLTGYAHQGLGQQALSLYESMQLEGITPADRVTFACLLKACASIGALHQGKELHSQIKERGLEHDVVVSNSLVDMYAKCGSLIDARIQFDRLATKDVVTWTAMIAGYARHGLGQEALGLYASMQQEGVIPANRVTFVCLLNACGSIGALHEGKQLHCQIQERGLEADVVVGNCLVDMYAKCGSVEDARRVFDRLPTRDVSVWTALIAAYAEYGLGHDALNLYAAMLQEGISPGDHVTFLCLLKACASVGALDQGKQIHSQIQESGLETDLVLGNSLVDMYAKCGSLPDAQRVFDSLPTKDVVTWTALVNGYGQHNDSQMAMHYFQQMQQQGVQPNATTFSCLLMACSHQGLVNDGQQVFKMMVEDHGIQPTGYHYNCMVDLLGRSGRLDEAENLLATMECDKDVVGWTSLLSACKSHGDIERGSRCFDQVIKLDPQNASAYVLLGSIYANAGRWTDVDRIESLRKSTGACKKPARAWIEVSSKVHMFTVGEERDDISSQLRSANFKLGEEGGQVPHIERVLKQVPDQDKEDALCGHAEKLALAYGLLNTPDGTTLLVTKNLRMCNDCHSGTKMMSRIEKREIIVRDAHRVHHFVDGFCSCGDHN